MRAGHPSAAAIMGHPIHPIMVTLPIGSAVLTFLSDLQATRSGLSADASRSRWLLGITVLSGLMAAPSGLLDALTIKAARASAVTWLHAGGNAAMLAVGLAEWSRRRRAPLITSQVWPSVTAVMVGILTVTGWLGGELAYRKGIGMNPEGVPSERESDEAEPEAMTERLTGQAGLPGGDAPAEGRRDIALG